ncbi:MULTISPECIES: hypothetical protein [unclassified Streptomyces]|uniref:hypothetical protein n=1 Tax=unclassified Streptomyces TaxID=2593676 RepID=UPI001926187B|nr:MULTISPECIES: hypothetical protein [unclassified Streptomyces]
MAAAEKSGAQSVTLSGFSLLRGVYGGEGPSGAEGLSEENMAMAHRVGAAAASSGLADLDLLAGARERAEQLVGLLATLPFTDGTLQAARTYVAESGPVIAAFQRFASLDADEQQRRLRAWRGATS